MNRQKAFTLIELIVVIAIIAILSAIVLVGVTGYIAKAKNTKRNSDIKAYVDAFAMYALENGVYPPAQIMDQCCLGNYDEPDCWTITAPRCDAINAEIQPYLPSLPADKQVIGELEYRGYYFLFDADGGVPQYHICWALEGDNQPCGIGYQNGGDNGVTSCEYRIEI